MKRSRNGPKAVSNARKRQKIEKPAKAVSTKAKRRINLDELGWKTVGLPDRLDDFEGFYGLEEIEDVAIVKDIKTGYLTFETTKTEEEVWQDLQQARTRDEEEAERLEKVTFGEIEDSDTENSKSEVEEDSWEGFGEEEADADTNSSVSNQKDAGPAAEAKQKTQANTAGNAIAELDQERSDSEEDVEDQDVEPLGTNGFHVLADQSEQIEAVDVSAWEDLNLSEGILGSLSSLGFSSPTAIQASAIPHIIAGKDVVGKASTGSGKTLAFGIPIVEAFLASASSYRGTKSTCPIALIISPTRELAHQIAEHLKGLCDKGDFTAPYIASVTGGLSVQKQRRQLGKADIIVGTPGRLWEVISSGHGLLEKCQSIQFLVIDEADRMLSEGHYKELGEILKVLDQDRDAQKGLVSVSREDSPRQTLVFSATLKKGLQGKLAGKTKPASHSLASQQSIEYLLRKLPFRSQKPTFIDANPTTQLAANLTESLVECGGPEKDLYLYSLLTMFNKKRALVFTNSISAVRRLTPLLTNLALPALPLHSSMPQKARLRSIERFKERPGSILVATDVAARGLDIPHVEVVLHYHLPRAADTYIHRSGRTARASASGASVLLCGPEEVAGVRKLMAQVHLASPTTPQAKPTPTTKTKPPTKPTRYMRTLDPDRRILSRLKPRVALAKTIADAALAKEKSLGAAEQSLRRAALDLGVVYDADALERGAKGKRARGAARVSRERAARALSKAELRAVKAELAGLLAQRVNTGVSARYLTSGGIDVEGLLRGEEGMFLGEGFEAW